MLQIIYVLHSGSLLQQDAKHSPFVHFAEGALAGKFAGHKVFTGLISAMVTKINKEDAVSECRTLPMLQLGMSLCISSASIALEPISFFQSISLHRVCEIFGQCILIYLS